MPIFHKEGFEYLVYYIGYSLRGNYCIHSDAPIDHAQYQGWNIGMEHRNIFHPTNQLDWSVSCAYVINIYIYICLWTKTIFESYFSDRLTFSNIHSRTSPRIYRLALPLRAPEMLSSLSKSRISIFNAHLTLFVHRMTSDNSIGKYRHLVN